MQAAREPAFRPKELGVTAQPLRQCTPWVAVSEQVTALFCAHIDVALHHRDREVGAAREVPVQIDEIVPPGTDLGNLDRVP